MIWRRVGVPVSLAVFHFSMLFVVTFIIVFVLSHFYYMFYHSIFDALNCIKHKTKQNIFANVDIYRFIN